MAKQTFSVGQVLTAAQMTSLQQTAMLGGSATAKTTSYTLVAADAGTVVSVNSTSATTITVNTGLFAAGDTVTIQNWGSGAVTITAGTATVNTAGSLIVPQYDGGVLYFTSASAAIYFDFVQTAAAQSFVGCLAYASNLSVSFTGGTSTVINMANEEFDTDGFHSTSTNTGRITIPSGKDGKYLITAQWDIQGVTGGEYFMTRITKNGTALTGSNRGGSGNIGGNAFEGRTYSTIVDLVANDYIDFRYQRENSGTSEIWLRLGAVFLGV